MIIDATTAAVDNDVICHFSETRVADEELIKNLKSIFKEIELTAIVHPLVYDNEVLIENQRIEKMFLEKVFHKVEFDDIFSKNAGREVYYKMIFKRLYREFHGKEFPLEDDQLLVSWMKVESLGEIHSMSMCIVCGCGMFLSDDRDSQSLKRIVKNQFSKRIKVYNRDAFFKKYHETETCTVSKSFTHRLSHKR